ncbi:MAG: hypothetical protein ACAI34_08720 [Verrucomicrobium sp.]|nr:hypothetical protein [Verrucomicrobium sp.]
MPLRPPSFRFVLALVGASLILWGAKGEVLNMPMVGVVSLFEMNRAASWVLVSAAVGVVSLAWLRPAFLAWIAWVVAVGALAFLVKDLWHSVDLLTVRFEEMKAAGLPAVDLDGIIKGTQIKPGAVSLVAGLVIQMVGLMLTRRK